MLPPLLRIMINEPRLLIEHAEAYSQLVVQEAHLWQEAIKRRAMLKMATGASLFFTLLFAGIALMIWGATDHSHWTLFVVPLLPFLAFVILLMVIANDDKSIKPFAATKTQFCNDISMFKEELRNG